MTRVYSHSSPIKNDIQYHIEEAYNSYKSIKDGKNASYIPYLEKVDSDLFGISVATVDGQIYSIGDTNYEFGIESISKVFTLAMALEQSGTQKIIDNIGVDATGLPFNSVIALELEMQRPVNPLVNAGAIATNSLIEANTPDEKWDKILNYFSRFAGRDLHLIEELYHSESQTNQHNKAIALLLQSYGHMYDDPMVSTDLYTKQCSIAVTSNDLAIMAATLANKGTNPVTNDKLLESQYTSNIMAVMSTAGLYETSGEWLYKIGLPGKSGVGGGIIAVAPGLMGIAVFSPPLDKAGNSVKAQKVIEYLSRSLKLNLFE